MYPSNIVKIIPEVLVIIFILFVYGLLMKIKSVENQRDHAIVQVQNLNNQINLQNKQILSWQAESKELQIRMNKNELLAEEDLDSKNKETLKIEQQTVSSTCSDALAWGVAQAKKF